MERDDAIQNQLCGFLDRRTLWRKGYAGQRTNSVDDEIAKTDAGRELAKYTWRTGSAWCSFEEKVHVAELDPNCRIDSSDGEHSVSRPLGL